MLRKNPFSIVLLARSYPRKIRSLPLPLLGFRYW